MTLRRLFFYISFLSTTAFALGMAARADMSPPPPAPGSNIAPGQEITQVRMVAERVDIELVLSERQPEFPLRPPDDFLGGSLIPSGGCFHNNSSHGYCEDYDFYRVRVKAHFQMRNLGEETERMAAEFPLKSARAYGDSPVIENILIYIDDEETPTGRVERPNFYGKNMPPVPWATFPITFPPGEDVMVDVVYDSPSLEYILETGAAWKDDIGDAVLVLHMPYTITSENIKIIDFGAEVTVKESESQWRWRHLEPTSANNWSASITNPFVWLNLQETRSATNANPDDPYVWEHRAWAAWWAALDNKGRYYGIWTDSWPDREKGSTWHFVEEATRTYEKAAWLAPDAPGLQARYLSFRLANELSWSHDSSKKNIQRALDLAQAVDAFAARFSDSIAVVALQERLALNWPDPTATPTYPTPDDRLLGPPLKSDDATPIATASVTPTATDTPAPTATLAPTAMLAPIATSAPTPAPRSHSFIGKVPWLPALLAGVAAVVLLVRILHAKAEGGSRE